MRFLRFALVAGLAGAITLGVAACGSDSDDGGDSLQKATLVLDYLPNGVHAGIYDAISNGYYEDESIDLKVVTPTSTADTLRLIEADKADFGLADGIDIATQIDAGRDAQAIMAVTQRPSGGLITLADEGIKSPAELEGKTVGVTGVPSDDAVFEAIVEDDGGDPDSSRVVTIGFNGIQALQAGRISAFTGYIPADATAIEAAGKETRSFAFDESGGPSYPGLVAFSTRSRIDEDPELMAGFVAATTKGYEDALADPVGAIDDLVAVSPEVEPGLARDTFKAYEPLIGDPASIGSFDRRHLVDLSDFLVKTDLINARVPPDRFATDEFVATD
ncbi:MAG: ABC transporter substrate-binding protein [Thermoleophilia bacterium]|nr:ABC transporter substrate-binding protein [Thermoleophilia bacterium]